MNRINPSYLQTVSRRLSQGYLVGLMALSISLAQAQTPDAKEALRSTTTEVPKAGPPKPTVIVVAGAAGEKDFGEQFETNAKRWHAFAKKQGWELVALGVSSDESQNDNAQNHNAQNDNAQNDHDLLKDAIEKAAAIPAEGELWLVMIGHGTFASNVAKFNLVGPDVSAVELGEWLKPVKARCIVMNCSSCSGPFVTALGGKNRVVVTATRSGSEQNYSRFGNYLAEAIGSLSADVDHDQEVSVLEAFLAASSQTERFYREDARLATEHALLDDNGDRVGTGGDFYRGARPAKEPEAGKQVDGRAASRAILFSAPDAPKLTTEQLAARQQIEEQIDALRLQKKGLTEDAYLAQLEPLCIELAKIYQAARAKP